MFEFLKRKKRIDIDTSIASTAVVSSRNRSYFSVSLSISTLPYPKAIDFIHYKVRYSPMLRIQVTEKLESHGAAFASDSIYSGEGFFRQNGSVRHVDYSSRFFHNIDTLIQARTSPLSELAELREQHVGGSQAVLTLVVQPWDHKNFLFYDYRTLQTLKINVTSLVEIIACGLLSGAEDPFRSSLFSPANPLAITLVCGCSFNSETVDQGQVSFLAAHLYEELVKVRIYSKIRCFGSALYASCDLLDTLDAVSCGQIYTDTSFNDRTSPLIVPQVFVSSLAFYQRFCLRRGFETACNELYKQGRIKSKDCNEISTLIDYKNILTFSELAARRLLGYHFLLEYNERISAVSVAESALSAVLVSDVTNNNETRFTLCSVEDYFIMDRSKLRILKELWMKYLDDYLNHRMRSLFTSSASVFFQILDSIEKCSTTAELSEAVRSLALQRHLPAGFTSILRTHHSCMDRTGAPPPLLQ